MTVTIDPRDFCVPDEGIGTDGCPDGDAGFRRNHDLTEPVIHSWNASAVEGG
jgi:hypothetical protein